MTSVTTQDGDVREGRGGSRGLVMAGAALGAVLLVGGGAFAATKFFAAGGDQPDTVLPATSAVYARFDVDPSAGQKVAAVRFFQGLDEETKARLDDGEWREWLWEQLEEEGKVPGDLDYETDIEPWLGDRAGLAVVPRGADQEPAVALALQVKDGDKALATLDKLKAAGADKPAEEQVDYYLDDDYVVLTQASMLAELKAAAEAGTLDGHQDYLDDMRELGDQGIASMWADGERLSEVDPATLNPAVDATGMATGVPTDMAGTDMLTGRWAATVRLSEDMIEAHGVARGMDGLVMPTGTDTAHLVNELPADTAAALSVENGAAWVQTAWDYYAAAFPDEVASAQEDAAAQGFTLPDDLKTLLGDSMALSVGPDVVTAFESMSETSTSMPELPIGYRVQTDTEKVATLLGDAGLPPTMLAQRTDEGVLTIGLHQPYVDELAAPEGTLGNDATYKAAVADPDKAQSVLFVNVNPFEQYYLPEVKDEQARAALEQLAALGWSTSVDDASQSRFTMRFVADEE